MQKPIFILISAITFATCDAIAQLQQPDQGHEHPPSRGSGAACDQEKKQKYTCPMHPEVVKDHPGKCPKCGTTLIPMQKERRSTPKGFASRRLDAQRPTNASGPSIRFDP
jgi:uncharacterized protein YceK